MNTTPTTPTTAFTITSTTNNNNNNYCFYYCLLVIIYKNVLFLKQHKQQNAQNCNKKKTCKLNKLLNVAMWPLTFVI